MKLRFTDDYMSSIKLENCKMKILDIDGSDHLCLFAYEDIKKGSELRYDYGNEEAPWRHQVIINHILYCMF